MRSSAGKIARGVDVRADGGYAIWWPAAGFPILSLAKVAQLPEWLRAIIENLPQQRSAAIVLPDLHLLKHLIRTVAAAHEGQRNNALFWAACRAGEMVASGLLDAAATAAVLAEAATRCSLPWLEADRTAWNGIKKTGGAFGEQH
jgi:hypothetical protein